MTPTTTADTTTRRTQSERTELTRAALITAGRELFGSAGFAETSTAQIVEAAGVTRGALYHHFDGKEGLFEAVYVALEEESTQRIAAALTPGDPYQAILDAIDVFLDACVLDPTVRRISLVEAPTVLGWDRWRELNDGFAFGLTRAALEAAMDAGQLRREPVEPLSHLLVGALREAALLLSRSEDRDVLKPTIARLLEQLLVGYRT